MPLVAYSILHRPLPGVPREEYRATILDMHRAVEGESARFSDEQAKSADAVSLRQAQILRGALSQFLETPIRSDNAEVQRIFLDAFGEHRRQVSEEGPHGAIVSWAGAATAPAKGPAWLKALEAAGRRERRALGLENAKGAPEAHESVYVVRGGLNLDVLEHVVRDRLGIYASAHGTHVGQSAPFVVSVHNLIHSSGAEYWKAILSSSAEAVFSFDKGALPYEEFRAGIARLVDTAIPDSGAAAATLWQRKLGLGRGREFTLRFLIPEAAESHLLIDRLRSAPDPPFAGVVFGTRAALMLKEILHPPTP